MRRRAPGDAPRARDADPAKRRKGGWYAAPVVLAAATRGSHWYVMPAFTTFLVMLLLLYADPTAASVRFTERVTETLIGVGLAFIFGLALPALAQHRHAGRNR